MKNRMNLWLASLVLLAALIACGESKKEPADNKQEMAVQSSIDTAWYKSMLVRCMPEYEEAAKKGNVLKHEDWKSGLQTIKGLQTDLVKYDIQSGDQDYMDLVKKFKALLPKIMKNMYPRLREEFAADGARGSKETGGDIEMRVYNQGMPSININSALFNTQKTAEQFYEKGQSTFKDLRFRTVYFGTHRREIIHYEIQAPGDGEIVAE